MSSNQESLENFYRECFKFQEKIYVFFFPRDFMSLNYQRGSQVMKQWFLSFRDWNSTTYQVLFVIKWRLVRDYEVTCLRIHQFYSDQIMLCLKVSFGLTYIYVLIYTCIYYSMHVVLFNIKILTLVLELVSQNYGFI